MDDRSTHEVLARLAKLEREAVRLRRGVVTDDSPLSVALGGSDIAYSDVPRLAGPTVEVDDSVAVLSRGNDLLMAGVLGGRQWVAGTVSLTFTASSISATAAVTHGLGVAPVAVVYSPRGSHLGAYTPSRDTTTFTAQAFYTAETGFSLSGTFVFDWIAVG